MIDRYGNETPDFVFGLDLAKGEDKYMITVAECNADGSKTFLKAFEPSPAQAKIIELVTSPPLPQVYWPSQNRHWKPIPFKPKDLRYLRNKAGGWKIREARRMWPERKVHTIKRLADDFKAGRIIIDEGWGE